ncbi:hypothetical protein M3231_17100 [Neobacillus mesonae]|nr:hypothetical protein [Neobacillus mesonae]
MSFTPIFPPSGPGGGTLPLQNLLGTINVGSLAASPNATQAVPSNILASLPSPPYQALQQYQLLTSNPAQAQSLVSQASQQTGPGGSPWQIPSSGFGSTSVGGIGTPGGIGSSGGILGNLLPGLGGPREEDEPAYLPEAEEGYAEYRSARFPWQLPFCTYRWAILITGPNPFNLTVRLGIILFTNPAVTVFLQTQPFPIIQAIPTWQILYVQCF